MNKKINLEPVSTENFADLMKIKLDIGQDIFTESIERSLAQAYIYRNQCQPFAVLLGEMVVGYVMVLFDPDVPEYNIWHLTIDMKFQGQGIGEETMKNVVEYIKSKPMGEADRICVACHEVNFPTVHLLEKSGFHFTGNKIDSDMEMVMQI